MKGVNRVVLLGNLGKDPELKYTPSGTAVAKLSLATNERFKGKDGKWQDRAEWHNVIMWARLAEQAGEYLHKGDKLYVEGRLETKSWDKDGEKRYTTSIVASDMMPLTARDKGTTGTNFDTATSSTTRAKTGTMTNVHGLEVSDDDVPL